MVFRFDLHAWEYHFKNSPPQTRPIICVFSAFVLRNTIKAQNWLVSQHQKKKVRFSREIAIKYGSIHSNEHCSVDRIISDDFRNFCGDLKLICASHCGMSEFRSHAVFATTNCGENNRSILSLNSRAALRAQKRLNALHTFMYRMPFTWPPIYICVFIPSTSIQNAPRVCHWNWNNNVVDVAIVLRTQHTPREISKSANELIARNYVHNSLKCLGFLQKEIIDWMRRILFQ